MAQKDKTTTNKSDTAIVVKAKSQNGFVKVLRAIGGYFKGSWTELKQVRWPNRKSTWSMTAAVLLFSGFFVVVIILLDIGFDELFKLIIK